MKKLKDLGFKKVRGTEPGFVMYELTPSKLQAASNKHLTKLNNVLYRMYESKRSR